MGAWLPPLPLLLPPFGEALLFPPDLEPFLTFPFGFCSFPVVSSFALSSWGLPLGVLSLAFGFATFGCNCGIRDNTPSGLHHMLVMGEGTIFSLQIACSGKVLQVHLLLI